MSFKLKSIIAIIILLAVIGAGLLSPRPVQAFFSEAFKYIIDKAGSILFQNIGRKILNDFAKDAAIHIASGGKGQQALYIEEKWGNFWKNVGDKAVGDFVESFASSVVADLAADDFKKQCQQQDKKGKQRCKDNYVDDKSFTACLKALDQLTAGCNSRIDTERQKPLLGQDTPLGNVNICNPSLNASVLIGLGLIQYQTGYFPDCSWSRMIKNWENEFDRLADMSRDDYLQRYITQFVHPTGTDLGVALTLNTNLITYQGKQVNVAEEETIANQGWLDVRDLAGKLIGTPLDSKKNKEYVEEKLWNNLDTVTADIIVDAANIFLNQLAISGWQAWTRTATQQASTSLSYWDTGPLKRSAIENKINQTLEPQFADDKNFNVLAMFSSCPNESKPGPTECVVTDKFINAITSKITVAEAMQSKRLPGDWPFGFDGRGQDTLRYNQGYPYRSMLILRKYRILPVGWEAAGQKIQALYQGSGDAEEVKKLRDERPDGVSLADLISCYNPVGAPDDSLDNGFNQEWCEGLIDPYWVLKLPDLYCAKKGYGPNLVTEPDAIKTGARYCSINEGKSRYKIDDQYKQCQTDLDCCSRVELEKLYSANYNVPQNQLSAKNCLAKCSYSEYKLTVNRNNDYCADEQSCIKQNDKNTCAYFGYCTEEKRTWIFSQDNKDRACEPVFNTCESFTNKKRQASNFLQNTLDFNCDSQSVGCRAYATSWDSYEALADKIAWNDKNLLHLNGSTANCRAEAEGCHEFVRLVDGNGVNLIGDSSFEDNNTERWRPGEIITKAEDDDTNTQVYSGLRSFKGSNAAGISYKQGQSPSILPRDFKFELDKKYTLSAMIRTEAGEVKMWLGNSGDETKGSALYTGETGVWEEFILTVENDFTVNLDSFYLKGNAAGTIFYVDNLKFEIGEYSQYSWYRADQLIYQKLLPEYLASVCYVDPPKDFRLKANAPAKCLNYARRCNDNEVGCKSFIEVKSRETTVGKVRPKDYCNAECVGFDTFVQQPNYFYSAAPAYFIPNTAKQCNAQAEGCSLLVNLDKLAAGGEANEYYTNLRQCTKSNETCDEFYTWEGSDISGYQLAVYRLQANQQSDIRQPLTLGDDNSGDSQDGSDCNETIFSLPSNHPSYNADCRQFYGKDGNVSYHLYSRTISCSDACTPYRLVESNVDISFDNQADCEAAGGPPSPGGSGETSHWDTAKQHCVICRNNSRWSDEHQACIYYGVPEESQTCQASQAGCSEYTGNFGNNIRTVFYDDFENGADGWTGDTGLSTESITNNGHSYKVINAIHKDVSDLLRLGKTYELSFIAKRTATEGADYIARIFLQYGEDVTQYFLDDTNMTLAEAQMPLTDDWQKFTLKFIPDHELRPEEKLGMTGRLTNSFYIDNIKLVEARDRYYFIKNSWVTPDSCNRDHRGNPYPLYMLGCKQYRDSDGTTHYLRSFSGLCQPSAAGCEAMIDTYNTATYDPLTIGGQSTPADAIAAFAYDKTKSCASKEKGCQRLGLQSLLTQSQDESDLIYEDVYKINDPDQYERILCDASEVGCEEWQTGSGATVYFKDPGNRVCERRQNKDGITGWYKKRLSYCVDSTITICDKPDTKDNCDDGEICVNDDTGTYCRTNQQCLTKNNCAKDQQCKLYKADKACDTTPHQTIGEGNVYEKLQPYGFSYAVESVKPALQYAGVCPKAEAGCTEYIDPESRANGDVQGAPLASDTLYIITLDKNGSTTLNCQSSIKDAILTIYSLGDNDNKPEDNNQIKLRGDSLSLVNNDKNDKPWSEEIYFTVTKDDKLQVDRKISCSLSGAVLSIKKSIVSYRLRDSLNKEKPLEVSFVKGQILFNERSYSGDKPKVLIYSSTLSEQEKGPDGYNPPPPDNNANVLLKVAPDRTCATWLACKAYTLDIKRPGEKICLERGLCNQMNQTGECINFIDVNYSSANQNETYNIRRSDIGNLSGYSKVGYENNLLRADYYHLANMNEAGDYKINFDGSFEDGDADFYRGDSLGKASFVAAVLDDPKVIEAELGYEGYKTVPDGQAIAKSKDYVAVDLDGISVNSYIASVWVYLKGGDKVDLSVSRPEPGDCPFVDDNGKKSCTATVNDYTQIIAATSVQDRWVRLVGHFNIKPNYDQEQIKLGIFTSGTVYFDDARLEPGLGYRDSGETNVQKQYLHSSCRLYPDFGALSCDYYKDNGLRRKGWLGYCLEWDPRNSASCLLWYPIDKVVTDPYEEGAGLDFAKDIYYCVDAQDSCNAVQPEMQCKTFIKVDKNKYWYGRLSEGSSYFVPSSVLGRNPDFEFILNYGVTSKIKQGGEIKLKQNDNKTGIIRQNISGNALYGAYSSDLSPGAESNTGPLAAGIAADGSYILPFLPYYGNSRAAANGKDGSYYCRATIDDKGHDLPIMRDSCRGSNNANNWIREIAMGIYDDCWVGVAAIWNDCDSSDDFTCDQIPCCQQWNYSQRNSDPENACKLPGGDPIPGWVDFVGTNRYAKEACIKEDEGAIGCVRNDADTKCAVEFCPPGKIWPDPTCVGAVSLNTPNTTGGTYYSAVADEDYDSDDAGCLFDCFNFIQGYKMAADAAKAKEAVSRLFVKTNEYLALNANGKGYTKNTGSNIPAAYKISTPPAECVGPRPKPGEPNYHTNTEVDYCYIRPVASNFKADTYEISNKGWVTFTFSSDVDEEQLPLRRWTIKINNNISIFRSVNMFDRPSGDPHVVKKFIDKKYIPNCTNGCTISPSLVIQDNWGKDSATVSLVDTNGNPAFISIKVE